MKRQITAILLAGMLLLMGCESGTADEAGASGTPGVSGGNGTRSTAEEETVNFPGSAGEAAQETAAPDRISYIYEDFCSMSLALPEGWAYRYDPVTTEPSDAGESEEEETPAFRYGIRFWAEDFPEDKFGLYYYPGRIGMCGTGVTIEPVAFANGLTGTSYTEQISDGLWRTVIYDCPDGFAGSVALEYAGVSEDMLAAHKIQLEEILESVQIGE